ncbi:MAG TPA: hypothetical protein QGF58_24575 [Myxococcota bacterium]|nr:hypothetical protein [Myxococcota bacterium]
MTSLWLLWSCGGEPEEVVSGLVAPGCSAYQADPDALAYCNYLDTMGASDLAVAERQCSAAGVWEQRCRSAWISGHAERVDRDAALAFCSDESCRFDVIDRHLDPDIHGQIALCTEHTPTYRLACIDHALIAWSQSAPSQEAMAELAALPDMDPRRVGMALGEVVLCVEGRECTGDGGVLAGCEEVVRRDDRGICEGAIPNAPGLSPGGH